MEHADITEKMIGAAIEVHRRLGPGFLESIYENALVHELRKRGMRVEQQVEFKVLYDGLEMGTHRLDLIVENIIVVELKTVEHLNDVFFKIVRSYLAATNNKHGLIINFAKPKLEVKRVIYDPNYSS